MTPSPPILSQLRSLSRPAKLFLLMILLDGLFFSGWSLFFNFYILEAGFDRDFLGLVNAMPSIASLVMGLPMGLLSDRMGRKRAMAAGLLVSNAAMITQASVRQPLVMLAMAFVWGTAAQLYILSQSPFMMKASDERSRDLLFSVSFGMYPLAGTVGNLIAGQLPGLFGGLLHVPVPGAEAYRAVLLASVVSSFVMLIPLVLIREPEQPPPRPSPAGKTPAGEGENQPPSASPRRKDGSGGSELAGEGEARPLWRALLRPLTLKLALPNLLIGLGAAILVPYMNLFFAEHFGLSDQTLGVLFSLAALLTGVACLVAPRLVGNLGGKVRMVVIGQAVSLVFLFLIGFSPFAWLAVAGFLVRGTLMNRVGPLFEAFAMEQTPEAERGAVNSGRGLAWNTGWAVGPYLSGLVQQSYGFTPLFIATAALYAAATMFTWVTFRRREGTEAAGALTFSA